MRATTPIFVLLFALTAALAAMAATFPWAYGAAAVLLVLTVTVAAPSGGLRVQRVVRPVVSRRGRPPRG